MISILLDEEYRDGLKSIGDKIGMVCDADLNTITLIPQALYCHHMEFMQTISGNKDIVL